MSVLASVIGVAGLVGVAYGIWEMYQPAGYVAAGVELLILSWRLS